MKNDPSFKFAAAIIFAGVIIALWSPGQSVAHTDPAAAPVPPAHATE